MENLRKLQECNKRNTTFKRAFAKFGVTRDDTLLKEMNEEEEFSALVNWAINQLPEYEDMDLRYKVNGKVYQTTLRKRSREIRVGKTREEDYQDEVITYGWPEDVTYETLNVDIIAISVLRAKVMIEAKNKDRRCLNKKPQQECVHKLIGRSSKRD